MVMVVAVILSTLTLAFAASNVAKTEAMNDTMLEESKIAGGDIIDISIVPWQVAILAPDKRICGGSIIRADVALSAAHCLFRANLEELKIRSGSNHHNRTGRVVAVARVKIHPQFMACLGCLNYDITLLFLEGSAISLGIPAATIALWNAGTFFPPGKSASLAGWGETEEGGEPSDVLRRVTVKVVPAHLCARYGARVPYLNICAGYLRGGRDSCKGDSGGGLVIGDKLAGITAIGDGCGKPGIPAAYTSIPVFREWIQHEANI